MGADTQSRPLIAWQPGSGPQRALLACPAFEVFFGGARGGGKTDAMLGEWAQHAGKYGEHAIGLMVRRTRLQLTETFERAKAIYRPLGAVFNEVPMRITMPNGARLNFAYLEHDSDAENYQGHSYTRVYIEEAGNFPSPAPIMKLMAALRSGAGVPCRMRLTGNPGGPGHQWVKARYIDPAPMGWTPIHDPQTGLDRVYIPSRVTDNHYLGDSYVAQLRQSGSAELVRAWLEGDWSVVAGAYFPEFDPFKHIVQPQALPRHWTRFRSFDWGSARPFCCLWIAISDGTDVFPANAAIVYREWYGSTGEPNMGLRLPAEAVGRGILEQEDADEAISMSVCDPAMMREDGGPSMAERMIGIPWVGADNSRVAGWDQLRSRLRGADGKPGLYVFSTCTNLIRTLPAMQHDTHRPEDLEGGEDHACFAADTLIRTRAGVLPIGAMVGSVGQVMGADRQWRSYCAARLTRQNAKVVRLTFSDGWHVTCTPDHRFLTAAGWVLASNLHGPSRYVLVATGEKSCSPAINSEAADTKGREHAVASMPVTSHPTSALECTSIEPAGRVDVYCLTVPDGAAFALASGAIVHNCDALRYGIMGRLWQAPVLPKANPVRDSWDRAFARAMDDDAGDDWRTV